VTARELVRKIRQHGGELVRQRGSHASYRIGTCITTVPMHSGDIALGTLRAIERDLAPCVGDQRWLRR
jgi:predicted RNA binding protein YcfA (HicA-like mRNA interferase family)